MGGWTPTLSWEQVPAEPLLVSPCVRAAQPAPPGSPLPLTPTRSRAAGLSSTWLMATLRVPWAAGTWLDTRKALCSRWLMGNPAFPLGEGCAPTVLGSPHHQDRGRPFPRGAAFPAHRWSFQTRTRGSRAHADWLLGRVAPPSAQLPSDGIGCQGFDRAAASVSNRALRSSPPPRVCG